LIDSHAHLNDPHYDQILSEVIIRAEQAGIEGIINVGYDIPSSYRAVELANEYEWMYAVIGIHPHYAEQVSEADIKELEQLAEQGKVVGIGETGLDYYYDNSPREQQKLVFCQHLELAKRLDLPVVVHSRDAAKDTLDILKEHAKNRCVLHCYSGSLETAEIYLDMGHYISFAGPITFKNANKIRRVAANIPLDRLFIETDCPYLAPVPKRGNPNEPAWVVYVAEKLAELHDITIDEIKTITMENTRRFFRIEMN